MTRALVWPAAAVLGFGAGMPAVTGAITQATPVAVTFVGQVVDSATKSPVRYAQVAVRNTPFGAPADSLGVFRLPATLTPGNYVLGARAIGFAPSTQSVTVRDSGEIRMPEFVLAKATIQLAQVYTGGATVCTTTPRRRGRLPEGARVVSSRDSTGRKRTMVMVCSTR